MEQQRANSRPRRSWLASFILGTLEQSADEQREYLASQPAGLATWRAVIVLVVAAAALTARDNSYAPSLAEFATFFNMHDALRSLITGPNERLADLAWWSIWQFFTYVILPVLVIKLVLRERLGDYGLKLRGMIDCWWIYLLMYLFMAPIIIAISSSTSFQHTYPFYKPADGFEVTDAYWSRFWIWQIFYAAQFISLEFFFRGFMLHGTRRHLGAYSILVMMIPYCMIHYGKPLPETVGAIIAGILLGFMSLRTRSIWLGAALHISVAVTMDLAAIYQRM